MATNGKFNSAKLPTVNQSKHNLGNQFDGTMSWGKLYPIYCKQVAPGEKVHYQPNILVQTPAFASLTFAGIKCKYYSFFVPNRILWKDFNDFITGGSTGNNVYTPPRIAFADLVAACAMERQVNGKFKKMLHGVASFSESQQSVQPSYYANWYDYINSFYSQDSEGFASRGEFSSLVTSLGINPYFDADALLSNDTFLNGRVLDKPVDLLPFRAYQRCWWDWFRDSTLIPESTKSQFIFTDGGTKHFMYKQTVPTQSQAGLDILVGRQGLQEIFTRHACYDKDYFTTARLSPQLGEVSVVPIDFTDTEIRNRTSYPGFSPGDPDVMASSSSVVFGSSGVNETNNPVPNFSVETFRLANALQRYNERNGVLGTRPIAQLLGRFGVAPSAARLDMAEFIDGDEATLTPQQVIQTAETSEKALGDRAAFGRLFFMGKGSNYTAKEHGIFISIMCIVPEVEYCDGLDRMFTMFEKEDYFIPEYENLGFDAIRSHEIAMPVTSPIDSVTDVLIPDSTWGFQPRYSWMKWKRSVLCGDFIRPDTWATSDSWHSFRRFYQNSPSNGTQRFSVVQPLNPEFVTVYVNDGWNNWNRLFTNVTNDYEPFTVNIWNQNNAVLPMEGFATPALANVYEQNGKTVTIPYGGLRL